MGKKCHISRYDYVTYVCIVLDKVLDKMSFLFFRYSWIVSAAICNHHKNYFDSNTI